MADRFTYLPAIGLAVAMVWTAGDLVDRATGLRPAAAACGMIVLSLLVATTREQIGHWQSDRALFEHALSVTGDNWFVHAVYGDALRAQGAVEEATAHYERALAIEPGLSKVHAGLGAIRSRQGRHAVAVAHLTESIRLDPESDDAARDLALVLGARGLDQAVALEAVEMLRRGVAAARRDRQRPDGEGYYGSLARHLMSQHTETVGRCREGAGAAEPFDLFVTIAPDGVVASAATAPPSAVGACIAGGLMGSRLPAPPFAPFHARLAMNLAG
jgi:tetratricopeptide (TPR) repeat protein